MRKYIGEVLVDSGQVILVDPCYIENGLDYEKVCSVTLNEQENGYNNAVHGGVACSTGFGDGSYPAFVEISDEGTWGKRVKSLTVIFIGDDE